MQREAPLPCRDNAFQKHITLTTREMRVKRKRTFSTQKGSAMRCGANKSRVDPDDPRGMVRMYAASRNMKKAPITLAPMPWDKS